MADKDENTKKSDLSPSKSDETLNKSDDTATNNIDKLADEAFAQNPVQDSDDMDLEESENHYGDISSFSENPYGDIPGEPTNSSKEPTSSENPYGDIPGEPENVSKNTYDSVPPLNYDQVPPNDKNIYDTVPPINEPENPYDTVPPEENQQKSSALPAFLQRLSSVVNSIVKFFNKEKPANTAVKNESPSIPDEKAATDNQANSTSIVSKSLANPLYDPPSPKNIKAPKAGSTFVDSPMLTSRKKETSNEKPYLVASRSATPSSPKGVARQINADHSNNNEPTTSKDSEKSETPKRGSNR